jgi:tetratricopeptide (TPR) repeat protein
MAALVHLRQNEPAWALPEIEVLQEAFRSRKTDKQLEFRLWETQGLYMCRTGASEAGLKLLARAVDSSKNDYSHHAWGNGAYYMEEWGEAALKCGKYDVAEEGFLEALAHDRGSVRGALGLQVLCQRQARHEEASRYSDLSRRCWSRADAGHLEKELLSLQPTWPPDGSASLLPSGGH